MKRLFIICIALITAISSTAQDFTGSWKGVLDLGQARLNLVFNISSDENNTLSCTMDSPDQGAKDIPADISINEDHSLTIEVKAIKLVYKGSLKGDSIEGTFSQAGFSKPLNLYKTTVCKTNRPQTPQPPYPYTTEEITFTNPDDGAILSGTITMPSSTTADKDNLKAVVMITGSGQQNRDEEIFGHKPFLVIADFLARQGIATLRYDDRGAGKSTGDITNATTLTFKNDALSAINYLRNNKKFQQIGTLGHSEGGCISFMIAAEGKCDFAISLAGTAVRGDSLLVEQNRTILMMNGFTKETVDNYCRALQVIFEHAINNCTQQESKKIIYDMLTKDSSLLSLPDNLKSNLYNVNKSITTWLKYFISYDPRKDISQITCPVFAANGTHDTQVSAKINLEAISKTLPFNKNNVIKSYPGLNHLFQHCTTGNVNEYGKIEETISPELLEDIATWINNIP
ncbi:MAG: alpha/beta hydrolase family protein [Prevotella sp.]